MFRKLLLSHLVGFYQRFYPSPKNVVVHAIIYRNLFKKTNFSTGKWCLEMVFLHTLNKRIYIFGNGKTAHGVQGSITGNDVVNDIVLFKKCDDLFPGHTLYGFVFFQTIGDKFGVTAHAASSGKLIVPVSSSSFSKFAKVNWLKCHNLVESTSSLLYRNEEYNNSKASCSLTLRLFIISLMTRGMSICRVALNWVSVIGQYHICIEYRSQKQFLQKHIQNHLGKKQLNYIHLYSLCFDTQFHDIIAQIFHFENFLYNQQ